ncbi:MAG: protein phosphatase CheZ [Alphaproteobacteria bacterium]
MKAQEIGDDVSARVEALRAERGDTVATDEVIRIFEACGFRDLTGQRISKVITTFEHIEERLDLLVSVFGDEVRATHAAVEDEAATDGENKPTGADHDLLNGPQLPGEGNKQEDIDALLASFD